MLDPKESRSTESNQLNNIERLLMMALGGTRQVTETGTTALTTTIAGAFAVQFLTDSVIASYTSTTATGDTITGVTIPAGTIIFSTFTALTMTTGNIIVYCQ